MLGDLRSALRNLTRTLVLLLMAAGFGACESEVAAPDDDTFEEGVILVDASSHTAFSHLSLVGAGQLLTLADPGTSTEWHMAFRRFGIRLNGGVAGPGSVAAVSLATNASASADQVTALTPQDGEAAFAAVTEADIATAGPFVEDALVPDPGASWFRFDRQTNSIVANPGAAWKLREGSGRGFGIFRVVGVEMEGQRPVGVTMQFRRQEVGGRLGAPQTLAADLRRGPAFLSLADGSVADPAGCAWDLAVSPELSIQINGLCEAGTFPLEPTDDFAGMRQADDAPDYAGYLSTIGGAFPATVDDASGTFWYNIQQNNRMWPTYNVFLVRVGTSVYKVQIIDYYSATGDSGYPSVRFQRLR